MQCYHGAAWEKGRGTVLSYGSRTICCVPSWKAHPGFAATRHVEPVGKTVRELRGTIKGADGALTPVYARISEPIRRQSDVEHEDCYCVVHCPHLFADDKRIFGVDAEQALELSIMFIKELLEHRGAIIDREDAPTTPNK
ncbi:MAG: hypothetical protein ACE10M_04975 [Alphaproteobacteria bacterium]